MSVYEIVDLRKSIFADAPIVEAKSPKSAVEKHYGFKVVRDKKRGYILVATKSGWPRKTFMYAEKKG